MKKIIARAVLTIALVTGMAVVLTAHPPYAVAQTAP